MAEAGTTFNQIFVSHRTADEAIQTFFTGTAGTSGYAINMAGNNTIIMTRRYIPTWAIIVGVVGLLFFLIGALAFLIKTTETLTITVASSTEGTRVMISGVANKEMTERLNASISSLQLES